MSTARAASPSAVRRQDAGGARGSRGGLGSRRLAEPGKRGPAEAPVYDPVAVEREYRRNRARRAALEQRKRDRKAAGVRFWLVALALIALSIYLGLTIWHQIQ